MDDVIGLRTSSHVSANSIHVTKSDVNMNSDLFSHRTLSNFELHSTVLCNSSCVCDPSTFSPVCGSDGNTYYSACHAGCRISTMMNGKMHFKNCDCTSSKNGERTNIKI